MYVLSGVQGMRYSGLITASELEVCRLELEVTPLVDVWASASL